MKFLVLLVAIVTSFPALAEENRPGVLTASIAAQVERMETANHIYEMACYGSDPERVKDDMPSDACIGAGDTFDYEMDRLGRLLRAKEAIVQQAAIQALINQADLLRRKYNETCLSDESLQAEKSGLNNDDCHFVRDEYGTAVNNLTRIMHGDPAIVCTGDDCPEEASDGSN